MRLKRARLTLTGIGQSVNIVKYPTPICGAMEQKGLAEAMRYRTRAARLRRMQSQLASRIHGYVFGLRGTLGALPLYDSPNERGA